MHFQHQTHSQAMFCDFLCTKACVYSPKLGGKFPYEYRIHHSQFIIQNKAVQEECMY
jgi:hypothetical protein